MQIQSRFFNPRHARFSILGMSIVASWAVSSGLAAESKQPSKIAAPTDSAREAAPYPNCVKIFNGVNFDGWEAAPSTWRIVDGAMPRFRGHLAHRIYEGRLRELPAHFHRAHGSGEQ